jgi:hypothetical protein
VFEAVFVPLNCMRNPDVGCPLWSLLTLIFNNKSVKVVGIAEKVIDVVDELNTLEVIIV